MTGRASLAGTDRPVPPTSDAWAAMSPDAMPDLATVPKPPSEMQGAETASAGSGHPACATPPTRTEGRFTLYLVTEIATGRGYVGVTQQVLAARMAGHWRHASRIHHRHRDGSLGQALRRAFLRGMRFADLFAVRVLEAVDDAALARTQEAAWIARLGTMAPQGYNLLPGGASLGGPSNSQPVTVRLPGGEAQDFPSFGAAWRCWRGAWQAAPAAQRRVWAAQGLHLPGLGLAHARIGLGWPVQEALGLAPHGDRRGERIDGVVAYGRHHRHLRDLADLAPVATLRSRLHRARQAGLGAQADLAADRRRHGQTRQARRSVLLPEPAAPDGHRHLTLRDLAHRSGIAFATLQHRLRGLERAGANPAAMPGAALLARLLAPTTDRRTMIIVRIPGGRVLRGGQRELARLVQDDPEVQPLRVERLSEDGIRRRLRLVGAGAGQPALRWALGLVGGRAPIDGKEETRRGRKS